MAPIWVHEIPKSSRNHPAGMSGMWPCKAKCGGQAFNLNAIEDVLYLFQFFTWHFACSDSFNHRSKNTSPFRFFGCPKWFRISRPGVFWTWPIFPSRIGSFIYLIRQRRRVAKPPDLAKVEELKDEVPTKSFGKQSLFVVFCFCLLLFCFVPVG